jgi:hypothetical protein
LPARHPLQVPGFFFGNVFWGFGADSQDNLLFAHGSRLSIIST